MNAEDIWNCLLGVVIFSLSATVARLRISAEQCRRGLENVIKVNQLLVSRIDSLERRMSHIKGDRMSEIKHERVSIDEDEYQAHCDDNDGWCFNCKDWTGEGVEPDAVAYTCPVCRKPEVYGAEELAIMDLLDFE